VNNKGFLLLEVMVSVAILSIGLVFVLGSFMSSIRAMSLSEDYFKASLLLEDKLYEVYNTELKERSLSDEFDDFGKRFSWHLDVEKLEDFPLFQVGLKILWDKRTRQHELSLITYFR